MDTRTDAEVVDAWLDDHWSRGGFGCDVADAISDGTAVDAAWAWALEQDPPKPHCEHAAHNGRHRPHGSHPYVWRGWRDLRTMPESGGTRIPPRPFVIDYANCRCVADPVVPGEWARRIAEREAAERVLSRAINRIRDMVRWGGR